MTSATSRLIEPYNAVGLIPSYRPITRRADIDANIDHLEHLATGALWLVNLDIPARLLVLPEGALQGFPDEIGDADHAEYAAHCAIDIPGSETDRLAELAQRRQVYILAQAKARHPEWKDLFFNVGFLLTPSGELVLEHYKINALLPVERSVSPHDLFDWWIERYGKTLDAFWPVADTEIGRVGVMMAMEGCFPENGRGLAMNGAEVVYRGSLPAALTENDLFEITNRARALENNFYVIAPNIGGNIGNGPSVDTGGGRSMIVNYMGAIVGKQFDTNGSTFVTGTVDVQALRHHRASAQTTNWLKDVRTELAQIVYERPIFPKNRYLQQIPPHHQRFRTEVIARQIDLLTQLDIWRAPYKEIAGRNGL